VTRVTLITRREKEKSATVLDEVEMRRLQWRNFDRWCAHHFLLVDDSSRHNEAIAIVSPRREHDQLTPRRIVVEKWSASPVKET
jgi:hypothetical protein